MTATPSRTRRPDESMTLLTEVMTSPLDPGYAAAAARRAERAGDDGHETPVPGRSARAVVVLVLLGLLLAVAFLQARGSRPAGVAQRDSLVREIQQVSGAAERLERSNAATRSALEAARSRSLQAQSEGALAEQVARLGLVSGAVAVSGPGLEVTVDDAPSVAAAGSSDPRNQDATDDGRVLDKDLQSVVNGLWAAGAEAVSINGERLTALSAIRSAGQAVLVDYRPLAPPYRILAIGDPAGLRSRFTAGPGGRNLRFLETTYGVRGQVVTSERLTLPASSGIVTRRAVPLGATGAATRTTPETP